MKKFDKFILWFFSLIMMLIIIFIVLLIFNLFGARDLLERIPNMFYTFIASDRDIIIATTVILVVLFMLALKGFLFQSRNKKEKIDGILLENNNGKLLISRETLENLVRDISKKIEGTESVFSKIHLDENNEIVVNINAVVYQDAIIKEVTKKMQENIKGAIKQASDLEVSEVNVNIEKISNKVSPKIKKQEEVETELHKTENIIVEDEEIEEEPEAEKVKPKDKLQTKPKTKESEDKSTSKVETKTAKVKK